MMKKKLLIKSIIIYFLLYHIVFEYLINLHGLKYENLYTPLGRIFRKFMLNQNIYYNFDIKDLLIFIFNLIVSTILFIASYKWVLKENFLKAFFKLIITFLLINLILLFFLYAGGIGLATIPVYVLFFLKPMSVMVLIIALLLWINKRMIEKNYA
ncbi:hypothetical protein F3J23_09235 [Chryseobacterium sp. Tr-659]|uniref:hypothetical protein n=1 Tax=Chryseobacterium sp. Tr-659 TaxID=2608340 RepID=UPI001421E54D|nr:hypothetical protein [Chryseobacterium sp. Tr-659]NIF05626.1 hypothetical protein [Chryseobacterium sp. Tr-659]